MIDLGIIMEKTWNFILYFLWEPWLLIPFQSHLSGASVTDTLSKSFIWRFCYWYPFKVIYLALLLLISFQSHLSGASVTDTLSKSFIWRSVTDILSESFIWRFCYWYPFKVIYLALLLLIPFQNRLSGASVTDTLSKSFIWRFFVWRFCYWYPFKVIYLALLLLISFQSHLSGASVTDILSMSLYPRHLCREVYSFRLSIRPFVCSFIRSFVLPSRSWNYFKVLRASNLSGVYLTNHSSESIHIWTIGTLEGRLSFHDSSPQGPCPGVGLEVKI